MYLAFDGNVEIIAHILADQVLFRWNCSSDGLGPVYLVYPRKEELESPRQSDGKHQPESKLAL
jgi:hypothetical protein